jgi:hypothetical protein
VNEAPQAEEDEKESEIISTILKRKVSDFSQSIILNAKNRESSMQFKVRPLGQVTNSDQSAYSNVPESDLPTTGIVRSSAPNLESFKVERFIEEDLVPDIKKKDFEILMSSNDVD